MDENIIWAAGLFDGEGCITVRLNRATSRTKGKTDVYSLSIKVTMCDKKTIFRLKDIFKVGHITLQKRNLPWHNTYSWTCMTRDAITVLDLISDYLFTKQKEYFIAKEFAALPSGRQGRCKTDPALVEKRKSIYLRLRKQKEDNFYD
jgi:hypothetical protein